MRFEETIYVRKLADLRASRLVFVYFVSFKIADYMSISDFSTLSILYISSHLLSLPI